VREINQHLLISNNLIRISIGIKEVDDLIPDLESGFSAAE